ncbi:MAG: glycosyl hydrolase family 95 catalytic domain-containing protein [Alloprevotella sp.]
MAILFPLTAQKPLSPNGELHSLISPTPAHAIPYTPMTLPSLPFKLAALLLPLAACAMASPADDAYFDRHRELATAVWTAPFPFESVHTQDAPKGPYLGNGDVGVVAYTDCRSQTFRLSKVDFVTDGWSDWAGTGAAALPAAEVSIGIEGSEAEGFRYEMQQLEARLVMRTGTEQPVEMVTWLTMDENLLVTELRNLSARPVTAWTETRTLPSDRYASTVTWHDGLTQLARRTKADGDVRWISQVGVSSRLLGAEPLRVAADSTVCDKVRTTFLLLPGQTVCVATQISGGGTGDDARLAEARHALTRLTLRGLRAKRQNHDSWWNDMWRRSYVDTNDSLLNRQYLSSIYLLSSAYSPQAPSCGGMYGVWNMDDQMMYHGDIHLNYNSQAGFYSVFSANRPELALPFVDFVERMVPEGRRRAREEMGQVHPSLQGKSCRGVLFPVSALGIGAFYGGYWQQTMDAPFCVPLLSWYYEYTGDRDYLARRAYPFLRECGDFYEDYLQKESCEGGYRYCITTGGHESSWDLNPPSDLAFVEQVFRLLLRYSEVLDVDAPRRALWRDIVNHLPAYRVVQPTRTPNEGLPVFAKNEAGWDWPAHVIQLHCAYPCETLHLHSDTALLQTARQTLYYYGVSQRGLTETMNELGLSAFVMGARIGFPPEILLDNLRTLCRRGEQNFLIRDGHHCLEKTAMVETLHSMMLQSVEGVLHLFPCWPATPASFRQLRTKGAFLVSAHYDGQRVDSLRIQSTQGGTCRVQNPWPGSRIEVLRGRHRVTVSEQGGVWQFDTRKGETYELRAQAPQRQARQSLLQTARSTR